MACDTVRDKAPMGRKTMDIAKTTAKLNKKNMKNAAGVRHRLAMK